MEEKMEASLKASLDNALKRLRMPAALKEYSSIASQALQQQCSYEQYLLNVSKRELDERTNNRIKYLLKQAKFPKVKTLSDFDFSKTEIQKEAILQICSGNFLADAENIIFFGCPGSGKTHLATSIGRELCLKGRKVLFHTGCSLLQELVKAKNNLTLTRFFKKLESYELVIIDELGYIPFDKTEGDLLFQFISHRYEQKSLLITTNLAFSEWDSLFKDEMVATAAIDRLVHHSQIFNFSEYSSYREEQAKKRLKVTK